jgi:suppressor for copper-sensitivity B
MLRRSLIAALAAVALTSDAAWALHAPDHGLSPGSTEKAVFDLALDRSAYAAGETVRLAALVTVEDGWHLNSNQPTFDFLIPTAIDLIVPDGWRLEKIDYPPGVMKKFAFTGGQAISVYDGEVTIMARLVAPDDAAPPDKSVVDATLEYQACSDTICLPPVTTSASVLVSLNEAGKAINASIFNPVPTAAPDAASLVFVLLAALIGGLILNAMPCVLPVLSLKLFSLVKSAGADHALVAKGALSVFAGILLSFWGLAAAAAGARAAGVAVGWGIQFQEPVFVAVLAVIVLLFCLNLWGVFEIRLPGVIADAAAAAGPHQGTGGHLAAGFFATLMATPCSAPFLGTAIGFALTQSTAMIFTIFTLLAVGMSLPYLIIAAAPGAMRFLPRPGHWMVHFKTFMGFLLAATAVWLLYVLAAQLSTERLAFLQLSLLCMALFLWARSKSQKRVARMLASVATVAAIGVAISIASGGRAEAGTFEPAEPGAVIDWKVFDRDRAEQLSMQGTPVFVDVTADWCLTCKVNEALVLETREVGDAFRSFGVVAMRADWTNRDDEITRFLQDHGRYGIPFYLLYEPGGNTHLFGELITKSEVISAVERAAGATVTVKR